MGENLNESDRLVIAGQPVPEELTPLDKTAGGRIPGQVRRRRPRRDVGDLVRGVRRLTCDQIEHIIESAEAMA